MGGEKGRRWDAVFFGLTSWPRSLETAVSSLPGLHRLKKEGQREVTTDAEVTQEAEFRPGRGNCKLGGPKAKSMVLLRSEGKRCSISGAPSPTLFL